MKIIRIILIILAGVNSIGAQQQVFTVDQCVKVALENNPDIIIGRLNEKISSRGVAIAFSHFLPNVSARIEYINSKIGPSSRMRIDAGTGIPVPIQTEVVKSWYSRAGFNASLTLFDGGYNVSNFQQSRYLRDQSRHELTNTRQLTIYTVKERYYNLLKAKKLLKVAEKTVESSKQSYLDASTRFDIGDAPRTDMLKVSVQLKRDELTVIKSQNNLAVARASLNQVMGFEVDRILAVVDNLEALENETEYKLALETAKVNHPLLLRETAAVRAAGAGVCMAAGRLAPSIAAWGNYSWSHKDFNKIGNIFEKDYNLYTGVTLSIPITSEFTKIAELSRAKLKRASAREQYELRKRNVALEVKQAVFGLEQAKRQISVAKEGVELSTEDLSLNREKYKLGGGSMLDLIIAQTALSTAESEYIQALYDYKFSVARLERAMGMLKK